METALLVIDVQHAPSTGEKAAFGIDTVIEKIKALSAGLWFRRFGSTPERPSVRPANRLGDSLKRLRAQDAARRAPMIESAPTAAPPVPRSWR